MIFHPARDIAEYELVVQRHLVVLMRNEVGGLAHRFDHEQLIDATEIVRAIEMVAGRQLGKDQKSVRPQLLTTGDEDFSS